MRIKPPDRRPCENVEFEHNGSLYVGTIGYDERGPCELFFSHRGKSGTDMDGLLYDQGVSLSIAIQSGSSIEDIRKSISRTESGEAASVVGKMVDVIGDASQP